MPRSPLAEGDRAEPVRRQGLFPCDAEVARRLSMSADRFRDVVRVLENEGFPKKDVLMGGRFWPAIEAFWRKKYKLDTLPSPASHEKWEENLDAF